MNPVTKLDLLHNPRTVAEHVASIAPELVPAVEAIGIVIERFKQGYGCFNQPVDKGHGDFQSQLDLELDAQICAYLRRATPDIPVLSEEGCGTEFHLHGKLWVVDPIDGTSAYLHGTHPQQPSIMVCLLDCGEPVASVVSFPLTDEWFYASKGRGAFKNTVRCSVTGSSLPLKDAHVVMNQYADAAQESKLFSYLSWALRRPDGIPASLVTVDAPHSGAACRVVDPDNRTQGAVIHDNNAAKPKQKIWDIAAPKLIVEEAGGFYTDSIGQKFQVDGTSMIFVARSRRILNDLLKASAVFETLTETSKRKNR